MKTNTSEKSVSPSFGAHEESTRFSEAHYIDVMPTSKFYHSFRNLGYTNYEALADIIDNSLDPDVQAKNVWINVSKNIESISIADNGSGMTLDELKDSVQPGSEGREITSHDLGLFGCGLKAASLSMGKRFKIITKHKNDTFYIADFDLDRFDNLGIPKVPISACNEAEVAYFKKETNNAQTGTIILIDKLDKIKNKNITQFVNLLSNHLSEIYRHIIVDRDKVVISINGRDLTPSDTMLLLSKDAELFNKDVPNQIYDFKFKDNGKDVDLKLKIKIYYAKYKSHIEAKDTGRNPRSQGFYILRNNRQIIAASTLGIFTRHPSLNGFRAELFFGNEYDEYFDVSLQKNEINIPQGLRDKLEALIKPIQASIKANDSSEQKRRSSEQANNDLELKENLDKIKKNINDKGDKIRPEGVMSANDKRGKIEREKKEKETDTKTDSIKKYPKNIKRRSLNIFDYDLESQGEKGDICRFVNQGNGVISVKLNVDHIFYNVVFMPSNDDVKSNLIALLFSLGRAQEEILKDMTEAKMVDTRELFDENFEKMSRIFSKIIMD